MGFRNVYAIVRQRQFFIPVPCHGIVGSGYNPQPCRHVHEPYVHQNSLSCLAFPQRIDKNLALLQLACYYNPSYRAEEPRDWNK
jgi:hypothetical protein